MGVAISEIIPKKEISLSELSGKKIAIDAFNALYQFLTTIRQADGTPLMDSKGNITSHLSGLFYRNLTLLQEGIVPIYVFDGEAPELKKEELKKRAEQKMRAVEKHRVAEVRGDIEGMRKYAAQSVRISDSIIEESIELIRLMGISVIKAPGEGEAEAAGLSKKGIVFAAASQDYDTLLYGACRLVRNLTLSRKRRLPSGIYVDVHIELVELEKVLNHLQIDQDQLICLAILVGTDYNPGGVHGLGQKKALEIVQKFRSPYEIFSYIEKSGKYSLDFDWREVFSAFHDYKCDGVEIKSERFDEEGLRNFLLSRDFSISRINSGIEKLKGLSERKKQKGLEEFF